MEQEKKLPKDNRAEEKGRKSIRQEIFEWVMVFVVAAALAFVVRTLIFEPVRVDGSSMLNTLTDSDFMIATKFDYLFSDPERFDIVICNYPNTNDGMYRVKRIIGMPGDIVQLLGGQVRSITQAVVGDTALRTLALMRADVAFMGTNALTLDHGLSTADSQEAAVKAAMVTNAHKVVVLCDATKLGNDYLVSFAAIDQIDVIITDAAAPEPFVEALREREIDVIIADAERGPGSR